MVIYFTGTGNSKAIAELIADGLQMEVVDSLPFLRSGKPGIFEGEEPWVFVFPVYLSTIARIFADFIRRSEFAGSREAYFVATCASSAGAVPNACRDLSREKHFSYMGTARVQMPQNYIALFRMTEAEECERRYEAARAEVENICGRIRNREMLGMDKVTGIEYAATRMVEKLYYGPFTGTKKFRVTEDCVGCCLCARSCPENHIAMVDGKPRWSGSCIHCMACINRCPREAIEYGKGSVGKARYVCRMKN